MLQGEDVYIDGVYYYQVPDEELRNVHNALSGEGEFGQELGQGLEQETSGEREAFNQGKDPRFRLNSGTGGQVQ
ncbi:hypothetical protein [Pallidibacillus pasinlerensis]|uniref:hypothetical protein n=1 Tax=Pallidibacillus pasinlerensis TaxID=2703818 RepID=UPI0028ABB242|nr:hypothetical protein [Pallidibacillus pasinlerensis]